MENILTFDLEDWYHGNFDFKNSFQVDKTDRVIAPTEKLLDILK